MILPSVRAFFAGLIDYAGLFPPAKLPLDRAISNYAKYRAGSDAWMLGRFILPAARLGELDAHAHLFSSGPPWQFSVLGRGGETAEQFKAGIQADLDAINAFRALHGAGVLVDGYEVKLPPDEILAESSQVLAQAGLSVFYEIPPTAHLSLFFDMNGDEKGVKLRCGGLEAAAFPTPEQVAHLIDVCRVSGQVLKFTAGLHHPLRHFDRGVQTKMHGFLNVFGAGILAHNLGLTPDQIRQMIEDEDPANFGFDELGFGWKQYHAMTDEIIAARRDFVVSFGSCSFDEPRDDLRALGILP
jgi:hypothetical protein